MPSLIMKTYPSTSVLISEPLARGRPKMSFATATTSPLLTKSPFFTFNSMIEESFALGCPICLTAAFSAITGTSFTDGTASLTGG